MEMCIDQAMEKNVTEQKVTEQDAPEQAAPEQAAPEREEPLAVEPELEAPEQEVQPVEPEEACEQRPGPAEEPVTKSEEESAQDIAAEEPEAQPEPDRLGSVLDILKGAPDAVSELDRKLDGLEKLFNERIARTDYEEKIVDRMHAELQKYKEDMYAQLVRPILADVIAVRDSIQRMAATYLERPEGEQSIPNKTFSDYAYDLQDILEKNNVEIYRSKPGDSFTPLRQRVVKKVKTADEALHGTLAESLTCGYEYNGRVLSPEKIAVYLYEKPAEEAPENGEAAGENKESLE